MIIETKSMQNVITPYQNDGFKNNFYEFTHLHP